jgi:hypothetical protein
MSSFFACSREDYTCDILTIKFFFTIGFVIFSCIVPLLELVGGEVRGRSYAEECIATLYGGFVLSAISAFLLLILGHQY